MLTLKAPLELRCNPAMISSQEAFYHRITGNYGLLSAGIDKEDLLHVVTAPLELYLEEGGGVWIAENTHIENHQETKLAVINNVLNRIAVMEEANLTYQDRVFITDVLKKLGVREVNQFMKQVFRLKQETRTTERLISLYWNHLGELRERVEAWHSHEKEQKTAEERAAAGPPGGTLHQEIMNRLKTGAIYQILNNFQQSQSWNSQYITRQELKISEQKRVAVQVLLQKLRQEVRKESLPLVYRHDDGYRQPEPEDEDSIETWVGSQITSSVLLSLVDNLYLSLSHRQQNRADTWLSMEHALYQSAENTLYRLKTGFHNQWQVQSEENLWTVRQQKLTEQEIHLAQELLTAGREAEERFFFLWNQYGENTWQILSEGYQSAELSHPEGAKASKEELPAAALEEKKRSRESTDAASSRKNGEERGSSGNISGMKSSEPETEQEPVRSRETAKEQEEQLLKAVEKAGEPGLRQGKSASKAGAEAEIHFLSGTSAGSEEIAPEASVKELVRWVQEGRERFYRTAEQYLKASSQEYRESSQIFRIVEAAREAERSAEKRTDTGLLKEGESLGGGRMEAAETVLLKWQTADREPDAAAGSGEVQKAGEAEVGGQAAKKPEETVRKEILREAFRASLPRESGEEPSLEMIYQTGEQGAPFDLPEESPLPPGTSEKESSGELLRQIRQINQQNLERLKIHQEIKKGPGAVSGKIPAAKRDMRRDSLKALKDPEGLFREYEEERQREAQEEEKRTEKLMELLPQQTRRAYEKLWQYLSAQKEGAAQEAREAGSMGMLLRDIHEAETVHRVTEQVPGEELRRIQETSETILEKWKEPKISGTEPSRTFRQERRGSEVSLVHKASEHQINQEMLESLMEQNRITRGKTQVTHEETRDHNIVSRTMHQETRQVVKKETGDLTELVEKGIRQQMGVLSEQIYSRLEKRLQNEKKRRGF